MNLACDVGNQLKAYNNPSPRIMHNATFDFLFILRSFKTKIGKPAMAKSARIEKTRPWSTRSSMSSGLEPHFLGNTPSHLEHDATNMFQRLLDSTASLEVDIALGWIWKMRYLQQRPKKLGRTERGPNSYSDAR
jgi:hypothetical protein